MLCVRTFPCSAFFFEQILSISMVYIVMFCFSANVLAQQAQKAEAVEKFQRMNQEIIDKMETWRNESKKRREMWNFYLRQNENDKQYYEFRRRLYYKIK